MKRMTAQRPALLGPRLFLVVAAFLVPLALGGCQKSGQAPAESSGENTAAASSIRDDEGAELPLPPRAVLPDPVEALFRRLENEIPPSAESYFARGQILDLYGQSDGAVACWEACLRLEPKFARALERIALVRVQRGEFEQATTQLSEAGQLDPTLPDVRLYLGKTLLQLGRAEEATPILERQVALHPGSAEAWFRLGQAYLETEQLDKSKQSFQSALNILPECLPAWFGMSQVCERLGEDERASDCRARLLELDQAQAASERSRRQTGESRELDDRQTLSQSLTIAADAFASHGHAADAETYWRQAAERDAQNVYCRQSLGQHLARMNRAAEAVVVFEELHKLQPRAIEPLLALAALHQQLRQLEPAEQAFQRALEIAPDDPRPSAGLARHRLATGQRLPEAQRLAERLIRIQPTAENFFLLSSLCQANQDSGGARAALQEAIRLDPRYAAAAGQPSED